MSQQNQNDQEAQAINEKKIDTIVRRLPQYITEQLLQAIDTVRQGRMRKSDLEFEQCLIQVSKIGRSVQILITERLSEEVQS